MSVRRAYCGLGLGTDLMRYALAVAAAEGFHRVELSVRTYNVAGIALYEKFGFERVGLLKHVARIDGSYVEIFLNVVDEHQPATAS